MADAMVGEPEAALAVEDEVVRSDQRPSVDRVVDALDLARLEIHALDATSLVTAGRLRGHQHAAEVVEVVGLSVVADPELAVGADLHAVRAAAHLADGL